MNQQRRKAIVACQKEITEAQAKLSEAVTKARQLWDDAMEAIKSVLEESTDRISWDDLVTQVEEIKDEEQEYYDNMPEGLQNSDKGEVSSGNIEQLDASMEALKEVAEFISGLDPDQMSGEKMTELEGLPDKAQEAADALDDAQN